MAEGMINSDMVCRACIAPHFEEKVDLLMMPEILDIYEWLSDSHVDGNDLLPTFICAECYHQLEAIKRFRLLCTESYFKLHGVSKHVIVNHGESYEVTFPKEYERMPMTIYLNSNAQDSGENDCSVESGYANSNDNCGSKKNKERPSELTEIDEDCDSNLLTAMEIKPETIDFDYSVLTEKNATSFDGDRTRNLETSSAIRTIPKNQQKRFHFISKPYPSKKSRYTCNKCGKIFHVKERYVGHMRQHEGLMPFKCKHCHKIYSRIERLRYHIESDHSGEIMRYSCPVYGCMKNYKNRETLKRHFMLHRPGPLNINEKANFSNHEIRSEDELEACDIYYELENVCTSCHGNFRKLLQHKLDYKSGQGGKCLICNVELTSNSHK